MPIPNRYIYRVNFESLHPIACFAFEVLQNALRGDCFPLVRQTFLTMILDSHGRVSVNL